MTSSSDNHQGGGGMLFAAVVGLLMVACCALVPIFVAGGALAAIGGALRSPWVIGAGVAFVLAALIFAVGRSHRHDDRACCAPSYTEDGAIAKDNQNPVTNPTRRKSI